MVCACGLNIDCFKFRKPLDSVFGPCPDEEVATLLATSAAAAAADRAGSIVGAGAAPVGSGLDGGFFLSGDCGFFGMSSILQKTGVHLQALQPLLLIQFQQRINQRIEQPLHDLIEIEILFPAAFAAQTVIRAAVLRKIVGADALAAVAAAHHRLAGAGDGGVLLGLLGFIQGGAEQCPGSLLVLGLAFVLGHFELQAGGFVEDSPAGFDLVDVLPAGAAAAAAEFFDILGIDVDLHIRQFRQDRDRGGAGVDAALGFGFGNALHAMPAAFKLQIGDRRRCRGC